MPKVYMCMGTTRTDWQLCIGVESGYLPFILDFNIHLVCVCVSIYVVHYFIVLLIIIFIHSISTVTFHHMSTPVTTPYLYSLSVLYSHEYSGR